MLRESLAVRLELLGEEDPATLESMHNLAGWLPNTGVISDEAETLLRKVLKLRQNQLGNQHPDVALTMMQLGIMLHWEDYAKGEALLRQSLEMHRKLLGDEHPKVAENMRMLGNLLYETGHFEEAELLLREAVAIVRKSLGDQNRYVVKSIIRLGQLLCDKGELGEAETLLREVLEKFRVHHGDEDERTGRARSELGECLVKMGRYKEAENELLEAQRILVAKRGLTYCVSRKPLLQVVTLYEAWDRPDKGAEWLEQAERLLQQALQKRMSAASRIGKIEIHWIRGDLGVCLTKMRRYDEAEQQLLLALDLVSAGRGEAPRVRQAKERLVALYEAWGKPSKAAQYGAMPRGKNPK